MVAAKLTEKMVSTSFCKTFVHQDLRVPRLMDSSSRSIDFDPKIWYEDEDLVFSMWFDLENLLGAGVGAAWS